jgi:hypothetical protein
MNHPAPGPGVGKPLDYDAVNISEE